MVQAVGGGAAVHGASVGVPVEVLDAQVEHRGQVIDGVYDWGVPGAADGAGRCHGSGADGDRSLVLAGGGDCRAQWVDVAQERGQFAWPVGGWARVGDQHRVGDRPQPAPSYSEDEPTLVDEIGAAPAVAGEERVGERGGEGVNGGHDRAGGGSASRRCPVVRVHRLAERADAPVVWCRGE
ncbi:hypothetical protein J3R08_000505 [Micromonospora sp. HB375]|uniref:hypothetical protein n=1 Tax=Micromonospora TaxID=1873 RepID=UPI001AE45043|nr:MULTISPECIES: hypothetical protein [unclassified Micromonospora]MBP1780655.1 hypothetical protein [Micromonospora sp. HB375]MDH6468879.1 hypothetical protein [Micromonospora sp. H404/HB375]